MAAIPWDDAEVCINLEAGFVSSLLGLGQILKLYRLWDGTDEEIEAIMPQVERGLQALMGCGCFEGVTSISRTKPGYTAVSYTDGTTILEVNQSAEAAAINFPDEQATGNNEGNICAGARQLVERVMADLTFAIQQAKLVLQEYELLASTASGIVNLLGFVGSPVGAIFDAWSEWVFDAGDVGISIVETALADPEVRAKMVENLYCGIMASGGNQLTKEIYETAMNDLPMLTSTSTLLARIFKGLETTVSDDSYLVAEKYYNLGALNEDNSCSVEFGCLPEWCINMDFRFDDYSEFVTILVDSGGTAGSYYGNPKGYIGSTVPAFPTAKILRLRITLPEERFISEFVLSWAASGGGFTGYRINGGSWVNPLGASIWTNEINTMVTTLDFAVDGSNLPSFSELHGVILRGQGTNPFGVEYEC